MPEAEVAHQPHATARFLKHNASSTRRRYTNALSNNRAKAIKVRRQEELDLDRLITSWHKDPWRVDSRVHHGQAEVAPQTNRKDHAMNLAIKRDDITRL